MAGAAIAAPTPEAKLQPHIAGYTMQVVPTGGAGAVAGGRGIFQLEWRLDCQGAAYSQQSFLTMRDSDGGTVDSSVKVNSWEAADASHYRFFQ